MRSPSQFLRTASPEALFVLSAVSQYTGAVIAVRLFEEVAPPTVAVFRVLLGALPILLVSRGDRRPWTKADLRAAALFGIATALMNVSFYLAIDRLPLGKSVVMEFIGPISVAAWFTRSRRNTAALLLAVTGIAVLSGVEIGGDPLGVLFILMASTFWAVYIVLGRRVAGLDRGLRGLGVGLVIGGVLVSPAGWSDVGIVVTDGRLLGLCFLVGLLSSSIGYGIDQLVLQRIPIRRFAVLLALLPVTAMVIGLVALSQKPTAADLLGAAFVIAGVVIQERDELPVAGELVEP